MHTLFNIGASITFTRANVIELIAERWVFAHLPALIALLVLRRKRSIPLLPYLLLLLPLVGALLLVCAAPSDARMPASVSPASLLYWLLPASLLVSLITGLGVLPVLVSAAAPRSSSAVIALVVVACVIAFVVVTQRGLFFRPLSFYFSDPFNIRAY